MGRIITIGEPMVMFIANEEGPLEEVYNFTKALAGSEVNVAIGLARLGHKVSYITRLGDDPFGKYIYKFLVNENIDVSYIKFDNEYPTGFQLKSKTRIGDPEVVYFRKWSAASHIQENDLKEINFDDVNHIHLTGIPPALSLSFRKTIYNIVEIAKTKNILISFDPNIRKQLWKSEEEMRSILNDIAFRCDIVLPGYEEGKILTGYNELNDIASFYLEKGTKIVIIKTGEKGAFVKTPTEEYTVSGFKVEQIVDTVGAGDGFAVGVISGLLENLSLREAVKRGNAIGARVIMFPGDNDGLPNRENLEKFIMTHSIREG
ncbi:sugar kinase [Thermoanaerobacter thermohydrosulfuricus]|nr:sugar kinase [Clostridia bacterium]